MAWKDSDLTQCPEIVRPQDWLATIPKWLMSEILLSLVLDFPNSARELQPELPLTLLNWNVNRRPSQSAAAAERARPLRAVLRLARVRCCRHLRSEVDEALLQLYPALERPLERLPFGPLLLCAEIRRTHANLVFPEERCVSFHPALHGSANPINALRLIRAMWYSPEWLRYFMVSSVERRRWHEDGTRSSPTVRYHEDVMTALRYPTFYLAACTLLPALVARVWLSVAQEYSFCFSSAFLFELLGLTIISVLHWVVESSTLLWGSMLALLALQLLALVIERAWTAARGLLIITGLLGMPGAEDNGNLDDVKQAAEFFFSLFIFGQFGYLLSLCLTSNPTTVFRCPLRLVMAVFTVIGIGVLLYYPLHFEGWCIILWAIASLVLVLIGAFCISSLSTELAREPRKEIHPTNRGLMTLAGLFGALLVLDVARVVQQSTTM